MVKIIDKKKYHDSFNSMPFEYRSIAADSSQLTRINDLEILKKRVKENYIRELKYINERIKNYSADLQKIQ